MVYAHKMRIGGAAAALTAALLLTACAAPDRGPRPIEQVDLNSWRSEYVARSMTSNDPDMNVLYSEATQDCDFSVDEMAGKLSVPAVDPSLVLMGMKYVCPGQQSKINDALREVQNSPAVLDPSVR